MSKQFPLISKAAAMLKELFWYFWAGRTKGIGRCNSSWIHLHNRDERLGRRKDRKGVSCEWQGSTVLTGPQVLPRVGKWIMRRALCQWPILFGDCPRDCSDEPEVSFIIGFRGLERKPNLMTTLKTIAAQREVRAECVLVEQAMAPEIKEFLPDWVRHIHTPPAIPDMPYSRSWANNEGARAARSNLLIFIDSDFCVPADYAREVITLSSQGFQAIFLMRFGFHLGGHASDSVRNKGRIRSSLCPNEIVQNNVGGTMAIDRETYFGIGGHDEGFIGWGYEDNEFFQRCKTLNLYRYAYLPFVHLHHEMQPDLGGPLSQKNERRLQALSKIPARQRAEALAARNFGKSFATKSAMRQEVKMVRKHSSN